MGQDQDNHGPDGGPFVYVDKTLEQVRQESLTFIDHPGGPGRHLGDQ